MSDQKSNSAIIRHVVFFSAKDPRDIDQIVDGLSMLSAIPSVKHFEVSRNRNDAALKAYRAHQIYQDCIDLVRPLRDMRIAADF
jgi:hypothetical protein